MSLLVAEVVCASHNEVFKAKLFSSTLVMNGLTTLAMNVIGVRYDKIRICLIKKRFSKLKE